ncbi:AraC family transcriptional regulator [Celeribacter arenosi]|uniref:HTH araC/xylS-type domain-containing protein n=1 Tax=Celeribacter arenosi TaxID=792649 RepID=A0ABP7K7F8_9RHOB
MLASKLNQKDILASGEDFHFSRSVLSNRRPKALHSQDYFELFWLHNGRARFVTEEGRETLNEGDIVFVSPGVAHGLQGVGEESHLVNIIIRRRRIKDMWERYPQTTRFFREAGTAPVRVHRDSRHLARLSSSAIALEGAPRSQLYLDAFLLPLMAELCGELREAPAAAPTWLVTAMAAAQDPNVFREGAAGLVAQCGKAHAHVARTMRAHFDQTPSDFVNALRMDYAARQLAGTPDPLSEIADEIGIQNMSHFHRLFRARFGMTPRQYRVKHQKGVIQPV